MEPITRNSTLLYEGLSGNQRSGHSSLCNRWERVSKQELTSLGEQAPRLLTKHKEGINYLSPEIAILCLPKPTNIPKVWKSWRYFLNVVICLYKQMRSLVNVKTLIKMLISCFHQNHFSRHSSPWLLHLMSPNLGLLCHSHLKMDLAPRW